MRVWPVILLCMLLMAGCAKNTPIADLPIGAACPKLKSYSKKEQGQVKTEINQCGKNCETVRRWMVDYFVTRQQIRACHKKR